MHSSDGGNGLVTAHVDRPIIQNEKVKSVNFMSLFDIYHKAFFLSANFFLIWE